VNKVDLKNINGIIEIMKIDIEEAVVKKIEKNAIKYPIPD